MLLVEQHVRQALGIADRAYVMQHGHIVMDGTVDEIRGRIDEVEATYLPGVENADGRGRFVITAVLFGLAVLSVLSTCLALFTPRRPPVLGWLGWVIGLLPCEVPGRGLVVNAMLLVLISVFGALDSALGIAAIVLVRGGDAR